MGNDGAGGLDSGFSNVQKQVHRAIKNSQGKNGCSINSVYSTLSHVDRSQVKQAINWLNDEGHIYSTVDDDHYMTTD